MTAVAEAGSVNLRTRPAGFGSESRQRACKHHQAAEGRQHSVINGRLREAKLHWPLSGDELDERTVVSRPNPDRHRKNARKSAIELLRPIHLADLRMLPAQQLEIYTCDSGNR